MRGFMGLTSATKYPRSINGPRNAYTLPNRRKIFLGRVAPTWLAATLREFEKGVDCVAGYIDAIPSEYLALGVEFLTWGRLEDTYLRYLAEISARCDPRPLSARAALCTLETGGRPIFAVDIVLTEDVSLIRRSQQ